MCAPGHDLDVRSPVDDREEILMHAVEILQKPSHAFRIFEGVVVKRNFDFPYLIGVASLYREPDFDVRRARAGPGNEARAAALQFGDDTRGQFEVEVLRRGEGGGREIPTQIGEQRAGRTERGGDPRDDDSGDAETPRYRRRVEPCAAAAAGQHGFAGVDALLQGDVVDRGDHALAGELKDRVRRGEQIEPQRPSDVAHDRVDGGFA